MAVITGNNLNNVLNGTAANDVVNGLGGNDTLRGLLGNDSLNGGLGGDVMIGALGNDLYMVDNAGDQVIELLNQGTDRVVTSINFNLSLGNRIHVENMTLVGAALSGIGNSLNNNIIGNNLGNGIFGLSGNDNLVGLGGNDSILGGLGNDILNGGIGVDNLRGEAGNDTYFVDNPLDIVIEGAGAGFDRILSSVTLNMTLGGKVNVEDLTLVGAAPINGIGNNLRNVIGGNVANNVLYGLGGNDDLFGQSGNDQLFGGLGNDLLDGGAGVNILRGEGGHDIYIVRTRTDTVIELAGAGFDLVKAFTSHTLANNVEDLQLFGTALTGSGNVLNNIIRGNALGNTLNGLGGNDTLLGEGGNDILNGGLGNDTLFGGPGSNVFRFNTALGAGNVDFIVGYNPANDTIHLDDSIFTGLTPGAFLSSTAFAVGDIAGDGDDRIIYSNTSGLLVFDADGNGSLATPTAFANLGPGLGGTLLAGDFFVE